MKIIAYMNLQPRHIHLDLATGVVSLDSSARNWDMAVYPSKEDAVATLNDEWGTYAVTADLPDGTVFAVRGELDQTEGKLGGYLAGFFDNYPAAYAAAEGLGVMGRRGDISVRLAPVNVYSDVAAWKAAFNFDEARKDSGSGTLYLRNVVELAGDDASALSAADPKFAIWLKLNEKYGSKAGATA